MAVCDVLLIAGEAYELRPLARRLEQRTPLQVEARYAERGRLHGLECWLVADGPGGELASALAERLLARHRPGCVVSTGTCGATRPQYMIGQVVTGLRTVDLRNGSEWELAAARNASSYPQVIVGSADHVVATVEEKRRLAVQGIDVVDMETAPLAAIVQRWAVPLFCLRVVVDGAAESFCIDFNAARDAQGRFVVRRLLAQALRDPLGRLPELLRLGYRAHWVTATLADALESWLREFARSRHDVGSRLPG